MTRTEKQLRDRVRHWYGLATPETLAAGKLWYTEAHAFADEVAVETGLDLHRVVGVIAALSPAVYWPLNKRQARALCQAHADGKPLDSVPVSTYGKQVKKAKATLALPAPVAYDEILETLGKRAFKTKAFFDNIRYPNESHDVTIDQHIIKALDYENRWTNSAKGCYYLLADAIACVAEELDLRPCVLQAIIWCTYKAVADTYSPGERGEDIPF